jgi:hypothetical protein
LLADLPLGAANISDEGVGRQVRLQAWEVVEDHRYRRRQDDEISPAHGFGYIAKSLVNGSFAQSLLARFQTPGITHDAAGEARLFKSQPPRSAQQSQADNRYAPKWTF